MKPNKARIKVLLKNGYHEIDIRSQTIICPDGSSKSMPQWDIDYYQTLHKFQKDRGVV